MKWNKFRRGGIEVSLAGSPLSLRSQKRRQNSFEWSSVYVVGKIMGRVNFSTVMFENAKSAGDLGRAGCLGEMLPFYHLPQRSPIPFPDLYSVTSLFVSRHLLWFCLCLWVTWGKLLLCCTFFCFTSPNVFFFKFIPGSIKKQVKMKR